MPLSQCLDTREGLCFALALRVVAVFRHRAARLARASRRAFILPERAWPEEKVWAKRPVFEVIATVSESWFDPMALRPPVILRPGGMNSFWSGNRDPKAIPDLIGCEKAHST